MARNLHAITCYYMHYMPLHAPQDANVWNPVPLNVNGQIETYWSVLVRTSLYQYQQVQDFPNWYKQVQVGTRQYQIS